MATFVGAVLILWAIFGPWDDSRWDRDAGRRKW
jgi:hypothetical protein